MKESTHRNPSTDSPPLDAESLFAKGRQAEQAGRLDDARQCYEMGLAYVDTSPDWHYRLGCVHLKRGEPAQAEPCFQRALDGDPRRAKFWANLGLSLDRQGRRDESIRAYRSATRQPGGSAVACHNLGSIYAEQGRTEEAIRSYREAIALEPDAEGYLNLGVVHFAAADYVEALECFEKSVGLDGDYALGHYYCGLCLMKRGIYDIALPRFERAWKLDARLARVPFYLGTCLHKLERYPEAKISLESALDFFPEDGKLHYQLALTCDAMGLPQEARLHYGRFRAAEQNGGSL